MQGASLLPINADELEAALRPEQIGVLDAYADLVRRWNPVLGLVAPKDLPRFADRHVVDGLVAARVLRDTLGGRSREGLRVADLGSGAGLPGIPLAVALPEVWVTLVERSVRKARFLRLAQRELGLANITVLCADLGQMPLWSTDVVTARALMPPPALWKLAQRMVKPGGHLIALDRVVRSRQAAASVADAPADYPGGSITARHWAKMPRLSAWHGLLVVTKDDPDHSGGESGGGW